MLDAALRKVIALSNGDLHDVLILIEAPHPSVEFRRDTRSPRSVAAPHPAAVAETEERLRSIADRMRTLTGREAHTMNIACAIQTTLSSDEISDVATWDNVRSIRQNRQVGVDGTER